MERADGQLWLKPPLGFTGARNRRRPMGTGRPKRTQGKLPSQQPHSSGGTCFDVVLKGMQFGGSLKNDTETAPHARELRRLHCWPGATLDARTGKPTNLLVVERGPRAVAFKKKISYPYPLMFGCLRIDLSGTACGKGITCACSWSSEGQSLPTWNPAKGPYPLGRQMGRVSLVRGWKHFGILEKPSRRRGASAGAWKGTKWLEDRPGHHGQELCDDPWLLPGANGDLGRGPDWAHRPSVKPPSEDIPRMGTQDGWRFHTPCETRRGWRGGEQIGCPVGRARK